MDRGAEQGDPLGSLYCGLTIGKVMARTRQRLQEELGAQPAVADAWFMDDGQIFCKPELVDDLLRILDEELAKVGATRGEGEGVKSVARLVGPSAVVESLGDTWASERVRRTCKLPGNNSTIHVLGVDVGKQAARTAHFQATAESVAAGRESLAGIADSATELVLTRRCADVCEITYLLRAHGPAIQQQALQRFDDDLSKALALASGGPLHEEALSQACLGVKQGGLGARRAQDTALPAFVASRLQSRPLARKLSQTLDDVGLLPEKFEALYDEGLDMEVQTQRQAIAGEEAATRRHFRESAGRNP